jgi:hypothetical protein
MPQVDACHKFTLFIVFLIFEVFLAKNFTCLEIQEYLKVHKNICFLQNYYFKQFFYISS